MPRSWWRERVLRRILRIAGGFILARGIPADNLASAQTIVPPSVRVRRFERLLYCGLPAGCEPLTARGAHDPLRIDPANLVRRNRVPALGADGVAEISLSKATNQRAQPKAVSITPSVPRRTGGELVH
jgi:hypothetical protein